MPSIRVGFSTDLNITGGLTGIGTTNPAARLDVAGQIAVEDTAGSGGVSTFREYQGFSQTEAKITNNVTIDNSDGGPYSSLTGEIKITGETTVSSGSTVEVGKTKTLTVTDRFAVPLGETNNRDNAPEAGTTRFNQDFGTLEFFDGVSWKTVNSYARPGGAAGRGVYGGGNPSPTTAAPTLTSVNIHTLGNSVYFGDSTNSNWALAGSGCDGKRGVFAGGLPDSSHYNTIEYITMSGGGNAVNFGDLSNAAGRDSGGGCSSSTRALFTGSLFRTPTNTSSDIIDYVEIQTTGNALDFGDLKPDSSCNGNGFSSPTRGFFQGGGFPSSSPTIKVVTIASKGDAVKFGEMSSKRSYPGGAANSTRGLISGGWISPAGLKSIDYITMSSEGNAINFGDLTQGRHSPAGASTQTRAIFSGGYTGPSSTTDVNTIDYVTISTAGNAIDFGDLIFPTSFLCSASDSHGGLGGF